MIRSEVYHDCSFLSLSGPVCHKTRLQASLFWGIIPDLFALFLLPSNTCSTLQLNNRAKYTNKKPRNLIISLSCFRSFNNFLMPLGWSSNSLTGVPWLKAICLSSLFSHHFASHTLQVHEVLSVILMNRALSGPDFPVLHAWAPVLPSSVWDGEFFKLQVSNSWLCEILS